MVAVTPAQPSSSKLQRVIEIKIAAVADLHGYLPVVPDCDVLVIAGDIGVASFDDFNMPRIDADSHWWAYEFAPWLAELVERHIVPIGIAGNHDFISHKHPEFMGEFPWVYLEDSGFEFDGVKFYGTPWQPWFHGWAFNAPRDDDEEKFLNWHFSHIPDDVDVLITHTPPHGIHDRVGHNHVGSKALSKHLQRVRPKLNFCGHIHHGYGQARYGDTLVANVAVTSVIDGYYVMDKEAMVFEI